jgi:hypothetical protein
VLLTPEESYEIQLDCFPLEADVPIEGGSSIWARVGWIRAPFAVQTLCSFCVFAH